MFLSERWYSVICQGLLNMKSVREVTKLLLVVGLFFFWSVDLPYSISKQSCKLSTNWALLLFGTAVSRALISFWTRSFIVSFSLSSWSVSSFFSSLAFCVAILFLIAAISFAEILLPFSSVPVSIYLCHSLNFLKLSASYCWTFFSFLPRGSLTLSALTSCGLVFFGNWVFFSGNWVCFSGFIKTVGFGSFNVFYDINLSNNLTLLLVATFG